MDLGWDLKEVRSHNLPLNPLLNKGNWNQNRKKLEKNKKLSRVLQDIGGSASHGNQRHWVARKPLRCLRRQFKRVYLVTIDPKGSNSQRFLGSEAQSASNGLKVSSGRGNLGKKERSICREGDPPWERQKTKNWKVRLQDLLHLIQKDLACPRKVPL